MPADDSAPLLADTAGTITTILVDVPIGPRVLRVYEASAPNDWNMAICSTRHSSPLPVVVTSGVNPEFVVLMPGS
jgi:hypothetical protein